MLKMDKLVSLIKKDEEREEKNKFKDSTPGDVSITKRPYRVEQDSLKAYLLEKVEACDDLTMQKVIKCLKIIEPKVNWAHKILSETK